MVTTWQDWVFSAGQLIMAVSLLPTVWGAGQPARSTSAPTTAILLAFAVTFGTLGFWPSLLTSAFAAGLWAMLAVKGVLWRRK